jgi:hypothetical protein
VSRLALRSWWYGQLELAAPWLSVAALDGVRTKHPAEAVEGAVDAFRRAEAEAARNAEAERRDGIRATAQTGLPTTQALAVVAASAGEARGGIVTSHGAGAGKGKTSASGTHTAAEVAAGRQANEGRGEATNKSGGGGRNG